MTEPYQQPTYSQPAYFAPPPQPAPGQAPMPMPAAKRRSRAPLIIAGIVVLVGLGVGLAAILGAFGASTFTLHGSIAVNSSDGSGIFRDGLGGCNGTDGYSDMAPGTAVTVADKSGQIVATGALGQGVLAGDICVLSITVPDVPANLDEYAVSVSHRGTTVFTPQQAKAGVELTLGDG